jgi:hypothetical protein
VLAVLRNRIALIIEVKVWAKLERHQDFREPDFVNNGGHGLLLTQDSLLLPVLFRPLARRELDEAVGWYQKQKQGLGVELKEAIDQVLGRIAEGKGRGVNHRWHR